MVGSMIRQVTGQHAVLVFFFTLCQVIGMMCALPDLSMANSAALFVEDEMTCPMDGATMCPSSLTSSPERQIKNSMVLDIAHATILLSPVSMLPAPSAPTLCSWGSAYSIVPISIGTSSVLRI